MTRNPEGYFLFVGAADSESATTRLRAGGAVYRKKLLFSNPDNWLKIVDLIEDAGNLGTLMVLSSYDYGQICSDDYQDAARKLLDALVGRPHIIFVHEAVFLTQEQRAAAEGEYVARTSLVEVNPRFNDEEYFGMSREDFFGEMDNDLRQQVNSMLLERGLEVFPYRTNVERSLMAGRFLEDHERNLLFRLYVPSGRLYAQEAETLLGLFREWLGQTGRTGVRQDGYRTPAGQVFEFFSAEGESEGGLTRDFEDFSSFLDTCVSSPDVAKERLLVFGLNEVAATAMVSRFATQARRLRLDLRQRREERLLSLKHQFENTRLEVEGLTGEALTSALEILLPNPDAGAVIGGRDTRKDSTTTIHNYSPQFINQVVGPVMQNVSGTVNLGVEARQLLDLVAEYGGDKRDELETAIHELEDEAARGPERVLAKSRLKRFLADLGNRGLGMGVDVLQKYVEHKIGLP